MLLLLLLALQSTPDELAKKIEESVRADGAWLDQTFDVDGLLARALKDVPGDPNRKSGFAAGVRKSFTIGQQTSQAVKEGGGYTLLRVRTVAGKTRALFRMLIGENLNYHDFLLEPAPGGGFRIADLLPYTAGEWVSESFRRGYTTTLASDPAGKALKDNEYIKNLGKIDRITDLRNQGKPAEALKVWLTLPPTLQKDKSLLIVRSLTASQVGVKEALEAVEAMKKHHPGDPSLALHSLGPYTAAKRFDAALEAVDALEKATGGDAYLHIQRFYIHRAAGANDKARAAALKSIEVEKTLATAWWGIIGITLEEKKHAETASWLTRVEKELNMTMADLTKVPAYAEFVKSPEYAEWMKARGK